MDIVILLCPLLNHHILNRPDYCKSIRSTWLELTCLRESSGRPKEDPLREIGDEVVHAYSASEKVIGCSADSMDTN